MSKSSQQGAVSKTEVRGLLDDNLLNALEVLADRQGSERWPFIVSILTEHVIDELADASFLIEKLRGNPLVAEASAENWSELQLSRRST